MKKGITHLSDLKPGFASIYEVIYSLATEIHSWRAAVQTILELYNENALSLQLRIQTVKEPPVHRQNGYQYSVSVQLVEADPTPCLNLLGKYSKDQDTEVELSKFKEVDGTPICGIPEFDSYAVAPHELEFICQGMDGVLMRSLLRGVLTEIEAVAQEKHRTIERLQSQLESTEDYDKVLAPKSLAFAGRIILACARRIIGDKKSLRMSENQLVESLLESLATERGERIASTKGLLLYIQAGLAKESP